MEPKEVSQKLDQLLRLDTFPVGIKFYTKEEDLPKAPLPFKLNICQLVCMARYQKMGNSGVPEKMVCAFGAACLGLIKTPEVILSGKAAVGPYCKNEEVAKKFMANVYRLGDTGKKYAGTFISPLEKFIDEPDVVVLYGNPAQMMRLIHANAYDTGEKTTADTVAEGAMCSAIGFAMGTGKPTVGFPCAGDRIFGGTQHYELVYAAPWALFRDRLINNLEFTAKGGFSVYPVPPYMAFTPQMPPAYSIKQEDL
ncbi:MAG TPA: hypothetical protein DCL04_07905 [Synergistaceae bacterium]|nr:hypothetical protein [Synergistaceae bacterium]